MPTTADPTWTFGPSDERLCDQARSHIHQVSGRWAPSQWRAVAWVTESCDRSMSVLVTLRGVLQAILRQNRTVPSAALRLSAAQVPQCGFFDRQLSGPPEIQLRAVRRWLVSSTTGRDVKTHNSNVEGIDSDSRIDQREGSKKMVGHLTNHGVLCTRSAMCDSMWVSSSQKGLSSKARW